MPRCECDGRYATGCGDHLRECEHSSTLTGWPWVSDGVTIVEMWCSDCRIAAGAIRSLWLATLTEWSAL